MALIPKDTYPSQTDASDPNYPDGKARNVVVSGDGTGTPLEKAWINDLWGFLQALLLGASIPASGTPDHAGASQYLDALKSLFLRAPGSSTDNGIVRFDGTDGKYAHDSDVTIDDAGNIAGVTSIVVGGTTVTPEANTIGAASSTDNALPRFDGATGKTLQGSGVIVDDSNNLSGLGNASLTGEINYASGKPRTVRMSGVAFTGASSPANTAYGMAGLVQTNSGQSFADFPELPSGATLTAISVRVKPGIGRSSTNRMGVTWQEATGDSTLVTSATTYDDTTSSVQTITFSSLSTVIDRTKRYAINVQAGNTAATNSDTIIYVDFSFLDPGPRNS